MELRNYRSIESARVDLAPFTLIVGPNGSGKSNFADALVFGRDVGIDAVTAIDRRGGIVGLRRWQRTKPCDVTVDIRISEKRGDLDRDYARHQFTIHSGNAGRWSFRRELIEARAGGSLQFEISREGGTVKASESVKFPMPRVRDTTSLMLLVKQLGPFRRRPALARVHRVRLNPDAMRVPQVATENARLDESGTNIATAFRKVANLQQAVVEPMKRIIPGLEDIAVEPIGRHLSLRFMQRQGGGQLAPFSAWEMSEGALRALGILVAARQMLRDELLIIEEPEVNVHPGAARLVFEVLKDASTRGAVLVTTHSPDLLDAARDEEILVCKYEDGVTRIGPLADAQRDVIRDGLFSIAELMRSEPLRIAGESPSGMPGKLP
ncbi:MAG: AAA family ATPase [Planctomycetes bacterium]|nr:AAA family ATPase [Planctomycetota bacterium]